MSESDSARSALGQFEETDCKVRKGSARMNCIISLVGETHCDDLPDLVVNSKTRGLTPEGVKVKNAR